MEYEMIGQQSWNIHGQLRAWTCPTNKKFLRCSGIFTTNKNEAVIWMVLMSHKKTWILPSNTRASWRFSPYSNQFLDRWKLNSPSYTCFFSKHGNVEDIVGSISIYIYIASDRSFVCWTIIAGHLTTKNMQTDSWFFVVNHSSWIIIILLKSQGPHRRWLEICAGESPSADALRFNSKYGKNISELVPA